MNKIYKLVWNAATGCWSAASEFARKGKPGRVSAAFVLLAVAEPSVAACQSQNGASAIVSEEKQIITCTDNGDSNKPYKITTGNTVLENNGTMTGSPNNGNQYQTADATTGIGVLGTDSPHDKVLVKNNGSILWDKALNLGTSDFVSAVLLNKPANNNNTSITSVGFENEKNAKVSITMAESPDKSPVAAVMAYADNGTATFKNAGTIDLQVPVVKSSDAPNTEPSQPKAVYGYYSQAMMADVSNSGTIRVNAPQGSIQAEGMEILSTGKNGGTVKNSGSIDVTTNNASAWGIWFKADGETAIENSGKISVIAGSDSSTPDDSGTGITVAGNKVEHGSVEVINNSDSDGGVYVKTTRGDATGINFHSTVDNSALKNSSLISVWSESGVARGLDSESLYSSDIVNTNTGTIMAVSGKKEATGLYTENNYNKITINNEGKIGAASQGGAARGIHVKLKKDYQNNTIGIDNSGEIQVGSSDTDSAGIAVTDLTSGTREASIINNGKISLLGGEAGKAGNRAGIQFVQNNAASSLGTTLSFTNKENGEVDADENSSGILLSASDSSTTKVSVENYGTLKAGTALTLRGGDDSFVQYKGLTQGALLMGEGNNTVTLNDGIVRGNIFSGDGNDSYTQTNGTMSGHISLGNGNNEIIINGGNLTGNVTTGNGKDSYRQISDNAIVNSDISLGDGNNSFILSTNGTHSRDASVIGNLTAGSGNDTLAMKNITVKGDVALGNGNNLLMLDNSMLGDDVGTTGDITTGNGDDVLTLSGVSSVRNISLGDGDNILAMSGAVIDGAVKTGSGDDRLMFVRGTDADTSDSEIPSNLYTVTNNSGRDISLGDGNNTVIMNRDITFDNGENSIITGEGDDTFTISDGKFNSNINAGDGDNTFTVTGGSLKGSITGGSGADVYYQSAGDVVGNLNAGDGFNDITLDGGTLTGNITTGAGDDIIFLSSGKYSGAVSTGAGDDTIYLGASDESQPEVDISGLTRLDGGDNSDDIGDSLIVLRDLTGSTDSEGKAGDVHISGWENIDIGSEPVSGDNQMARSAVESSAKTATLSLTGDLDVRGLKINSGSVLNLSDTTESAAVKGSLINAGTIDLTRQSSPSQTLSVTGNYTGSDGLLKMNTVWNAPGDALGGNSQSDLLDITGTASGNTTVIPVSRDGRENVIDGDVRQVNHVINTVPVVKVHTPGEERAFTGTASTTGVSEVQLAKRTSNGVDEYFWTATAVETRDEGTQTDNSSRTDSGTQTDNGPQTNNGTQTDSGTPVSPVTPSDKGNSGPQIYNSAVAGYVSMPRVNMEQGYSTVATLHERRGENMALAWNTATPADGQTWGRLLGEHLKQDGKTRLDVHTDTYGFQFGHDFRITRDEDGAQRLTGGYVAYTRSDNSFYDRYRAEHGVISGDKYAGKGKSEAWSLGVTDTYYTAGGSYLDLVGQFSYLRNHYESRDNVKVSQNGWSGLLSAEAGHPFVLSGTDTGPGWLLEPQAQLAYQYVSLQKFSDGVRDVDQNGQSGLRGRVGARLAWNAQKGAERGTGTFYTLANLNHDFVKPGHVDIGRDSVREEYASTWMETGVGMQLPTGPSGYLYTEARYEKELGHTQRDGWQGTFGYKYTWK